MGSAGNGRFGEYRMGRTEEMKKGMGSMADSQCPQAIENIKLEDVTEVEYFLKYKDVPLVGENIELLTEIVNKRLVVALSNTHEIIGNLPVTYNFLLMCMKKGKRYSGIIKASGLKPIPYIVVNLYA